MKKVLISATMLIGMMASAMVFSSFTMPKENVNVLMSQNSVPNGWKEVGRYKGYRNGDDKDYLTFIIWEKPDMCGAYYWTTGPNASEGPDGPIHKKCTGQLRQNSVKQWYAAYNGDIYIIKGF